MHFIELLELYPTGFTGVRGRPRAIEEHSEPQLEDKAEIVECDWNDIGEKNCSNECEGVLYAHGHDYPWNCAPSPCVLEQDSRGVQLGSTASGTVALQLRQHWFNPDLWRCQLRFPCFPCDFVGLVWVLDHLPPSKVWFDRLIGNCKLPSLCGWE